MMLRVSQIFGPTIQGEGSAAGRHCLFLRLYDCNLTCTWCDTAYTWADTEARAAKTESGIQYDRFDPAYGLKHVPFDECYTQLKMLWNFEKKPTIIVISGGEPMMQQDNLIPLVKMLVDTYSEVHIETAGTIAPTPEFASYVTQFNVSPKLVHSGNPLGKRIKPAVLERFVRTQKAWFKFVVQNIGDLSEIDDIVQQCKIPYNRIMIMPEGTTPLGNRDIITPELAEQAVLRGWGISFRTHVLIWGDDKDK